MSDLNQAISTLPAHCEALVIGSGPAGCAAARWLALQGRQVVLVDAQTFPRDKTCGDGLVPDTHAALRRLGVLDEVLSRARPARAARCVAPNGRHIDVSGDLAVLPRRELDTLLLQAAVDAGARHVAPARLASLQRDAQGRVVGAELATGDQTRLVSADWVVLATGAASPPLATAGVCERRSPSGMAVRTYIRHPEIAQAVGGLRFVWHRRLAGGYGWIFEGPEATYNIGVGVLPDEGADRPGKPAVNLRAMFQAFTEVDPVAHRLVSEGTPLGELQGAPLRCDLSGATPTQAGLLLVGDAVGATYAFSGEGIGKAMETGIGAAEAVLAGGGDAAVQAHYRAMLDALRPRFRMYRQAGSFNHHPWLINIMVWRARHSPRILAKLSDILNERRLPGSLLTWRGLRNMLLP